jgi:hypothetical protein
MIQMWFYNNQLPGTIPTKFGDLIIMNILNVQNNQFAGEIPTQLCLRHSPFGCLGEMVEADCATW